jgi:hypothetical protein
MVKKTSKFTSSRYGNQADGNFGRKKGSRGYRAEEIGEINTSSRLAGMGDIITKNPETGNIELDLTDIGIANMRKALDIVNKKQPTFADEIMAALSVPDKLLSGFRKGEKRAYQIVKNMKQEFFRAKRFVVREDLNKYVLDGALSVNRIESDFKNIDSYLPCFDNMFIEPQSELFTKNNAGIKQTGVWIKRDPTKELTYIFKVFYYPLHKTKPEILKSVSYVDFLSKNKEHLIFIKPKKHLIDIFNIELLDSYAKNIKVYEDALDFMTNYACQVCKLINYDWIVTSKTEPSKNKARRKTIRGHSIPIVEHQTIEINLPKHKGQEIRGTKPFTSDMGTPKREHDVRGHFRYYKQTGMKVYVKPHRRGNEKVGRIYNDYVLKYKEA